jgi:hypothetical protein
MATSWKGTMAAILAGGAVGVFLAPIIAPAIARAARPATKAAIRAGMMIYQRGRLVGAEFREMVEDVTAEVAAELAEEQSPGESAATVPHSPVH